MNYWKSIAEKDLQNKQSSNGAEVKVNAHLHTPYSFSAFDSIDHIVQMALNEDVKVLGINDFFTANGYNAWAKSCLLSDICPMFNIEFIGLSKIDQNAGIRLNDPNNPGRIYISGKGLIYPFKLDAPYSSIINEVQKKSNLQSKVMCDVLNKYLNNKDLDISLSFENILDNMTEGLVRERHLAKALRLAVFEKASSESKREQLFTTIFNGHGLNSDISDYAALENEIRSKLLKAGGVAFVEESPELFLDLETVRQIILNARGIPTYPLLADSVNGGFTEYEADKERLLADLSAKGFYSVEFIPTRNTMAVLEEYTKFFVKNGIVVSFGTEHNAPKMFPISIQTAAGEQLSPYLKKVNYEGACLIVAHQYLEANDKEGYLDEMGKPYINKRNDLIELGKSLINYITS